MTGLDAGRDGAARRQPRSPRVLAKRLLRAGVDVGLVGQRLSRHVVICGFPRSGSTLLQVLVETCVSDADSFTGEVEATWACRHANRRRRFLVTKRPDDVFEVEALRAWYATRPGQLTVLLTVRDPRDVLTSTHAGYPPSRGYYCEPDRWRRIHAAAEAVAADDDVIVCRYEDLVTAPARTQHLLDDRIGWTRTSSFDAFHATPAARTLDLAPIDEGALGGVRAIEASALGRWRRPEHRQRLVRVLEELDELPAAVARWGYADDGSWVHQLDGGHP